MSTARQKAANKLNAQKSTGPTSAEGKAKSSANRLTFGFASNTLLIPGEDPEEFRGLLDDFLAEHQPANHTEQVLVERMAQNHWLGLRAFRLQSEAFIAQMLHGQTGIPKDLAVLIRYKTTADNAFHKAHNELIKSRKHRSNSEIGFESQTFGEEIHNADPEAEQQPTPAPVTPIYPDSQAVRPKFNFTAEELDFEICPDALDFLKKVS